MTVSTTFDSRTIRFEAERELLEPISKYLRRKLFSRQLVEPGFYEHRIDLYAYSPRRDSTVAVELKLAKWYRAFEQALLYQLCADRAFIALPRGAARRVDLSLLETHGVGLLVIGPTGRCEEWLAAGHPRLVRAHYRQHYVGLTRGEPRDA